MNGVTIGDRHSYEDWRLILSSQVISPPKPKINLVEIPMRDGSIDLTETLTGDVKYEDRKITLTFSVIDPRRNWAVKVSDIQNYLHGKRLKIIFDEDKAFYYIGRISVDTWTSNQGIGKLVLSCTVDPFKYDIAASNENWLWDPFDFETGVINEMNEITVAGSTKVVLIGRIKGNVPTFVANVAMSLDFNGQTYQLQEGSQKFYDLFLHEGENELTFTGNGTITIEYTGGSL